MPPTAVHLRDITKTYPAQGGTQTIAVGGVSLTIEPGEIFFLLGPSGCGKTTLLRMVAGFIEPTSGNIIFSSSSGDVDVTRVQPERRGCGMVFQSYALWPHMTVAQNVAFGLEMQGFSKQERSRLVLDALTRVRMSQFADRKPNQLSGGQQQRVALARALVIKPRVLLLDEPLSNLDARLRAELRNDIRKVCKEVGTTAIYVTHDQEEALSTADRIALMQSGKIVQVGTPIEMYQRPKTRFAAGFLGDANIIQPALVAGNVPRGTGSLMFRPESASLRENHDCSIRCRFLGSSFFGSYREFLFVAADETRITVRTFDDPSELPLPHNSEHVIFVPSSKIVPIED
jgi:iron(III) transport system ATP-binding protein